MHCDQQAHLMSAGCNHHVPVVLGSRPPRVCLMLQMTHISLVVPLRPMMPRQQVLCVPGGQLRSGEAERLSVAIT